MSAVALLQCTEDEVIHMPKLGKTGRKRSQSMKSAQEGQSKNPKVAVIHYPDRRTIRFWRATMTAHEFAQAVARYSRLVEE